MAKRLLCHVQERTHSAHSTRRLHFLELMKTLNLLIGNSDRSICNLVEVMVLDVCYNRATVKATRAVRIDELAHKACREEFDFMIFAPDSLLPAPGLEPCPQRVIEAVRQIRKVRTPRKMPILAFSASSEQEFPLSHAGVDCVLGLPFHPEELKAAVELRLSLPAARPEHAAATDNSLGALLMRGFQRLTAMW
jgi:DNA-binding NarL/FixJ family response regulator